MVLEHVKFILNYNQRHFVDPISILRNVFESQLLLFRREQSYAKRLNFISCSSFPFRFLFYFFRGLCV